MKGIIKLLLLVVLVGFALINHRYYTFDKGLSQLKMDSSFSTIIKTATDIQKVEYYKRVANNQDYQYNVYLVTSDEAYLLKATQDDIDGFKVLGVFSDKLKPKKISPIPFYVDIIVGILILAIPAPKKKEQTH